MAQVTAELALEITKLKSGLDAARAEIRGFKAAAQREGEGIGKALFGSMKGEVREVISSLGVTGGVVGSAMGIKSILAEYNDIADTALKLREGTEVVQRVGSVAKLSGSDVEGMARAVLDLEKAMGDAENSKAREALERYGLTAEGIMGLPLDEKILAFSDAFQQARQDGTGYNDLLTLLGKGSKDLIPLLSQTREALEEAFAGAAVVSDADVQQLAALNTQFDKMLMTGRALAALQLSSIFGGMAYGVDAAKENIQEATSSLDGLWNVLTRMGQFVRSGGSDNISLAPKLDASIGDATMKRERKDREMEASRRAQAESTQRLQDAAEAERKAKEQEALDKRGEKAGAELDQLRIDGLPDEERAQAAKDRVQEIYDSIGGISNEGEMANWAEMFRGEPDLLEKAVGMLKEVRDLNREIASLEEKKRTETERQNKELETLRESTDKAGVKLLSPKEQAAELKKRLADSFGLEINSGADVQKGLGKLKQDADDARTRGDTEGEKTALEKLKAAQEQAGDLAGLGASTKPGALAGETTGVLGMLLGKSGKDMVLDESKAQTSTLKSIERILSQMERSQKDGFGEDGFGYDLN